MIFRQNKKNIHIFILLKSYILYKKVLNKIKQNTLKSEEHHVANMTFFLFFTKCASRNMFP